MIGSASSRSWLTPEAVDLATSSFICIYIASFALFNFIRCIRFVRFVRPSPNISPVDLLGREISADGKLWADCWDGANGLDAKATQDVCES